ncbi:MAG TPA: L-histidine N(alpha)-methyltransferase, partial [Thermoanaerobaculia bacterium]|nr:L-histidine N(alpha)-methyltransferase [Thermoanaerobaculia bacterium]
FEALGASFTYVPIDVDASVLSLPFENFEPIVGDYRDITSLIQPAAGTAVLFLGSSIGNFDPQSAAALLRDVRQVLTPGDVLLLGADLQKPKTIVEPAYNDALGVTAAFNLNLLARINRELNGHFDLSAFAHRAFLNENRIEMHLVSLRRQTVAIAGYSVEFEEGETIHTENSYKYSEADLRWLAREGGFTLEQIWTDSRGWFADALFVA